MVKTGFSVDKDVKIDTLRNDFLEWKETLYQLKSFRVFGFKAFYDSGWVELNRITLLLGENSAGKSVGGNGK